MRAILSACVLAALFTPPTHGAPFEALVLAARSQTILKTHCYRCHGQNATAKGGFAYVLDRERLVARNKITPGSVAESELFQRIAAGEMPPRDAQPRPGADDVALLRRWIEIGAPGIAGAAKPRMFQPDAAVLRLIADDLKTVEPAHRRFMRYFTLTHLYNAGLGDDDLETTRQALSKLLNGLSWHPRIARPLDVDPARTVFRIDLRAYRWNARLWDQVAAVYPYRIGSNSPEARAVTAATGSDQAFLRADWFLDTASRPPLYHDLLQLPFTDRDLERQLRVEALADIDDETVARAGFNDSGVSKNNRILERHDAAYGAYWRTYDFSDNTDRQNIFEHPLGPAPGRNSFTAAGGEIIFHLPNGMQAYLLVNGAGQRIDRAPIEIVSDPKRPDRVVENGISCVSCHARGFLAKADQVRAHVDRNPHAFSPADAATVRALYVTDRKMRQLTDEDSVRYQKALEKAGVVVSDQDPITTVTLRYEGVLDLAAAAVEVGLPVDEFARRLGRSAALSRILGPLLVRGGSVQRQTFLAAFPDVVRDFGLAEEVKPLETTSGDWKPFSGHSAPISCVALTPDGRRALSGSEDRTLRLWDVATGRLLRRFEGHSGEVTAVAFSPDGRWAVSGSQDRTLRLWDMDTGREIRRFQGHTDRIRCVVFSADGRLLLSGGQDRTLRLWDVESGKEVRSFIGHTGAVSAAAFSPDGRRLLSGSHDHSVRLWDVDSGKEVQTFRGHTREVYTVAFAPDGQTLASGGNDHGVRLWSLETGKELHCCEGAANAVIAVVFLSEGKLVLSASSQYQKTDRIFRLWDVASGKEVGRPRAETGERVGCVAVSRDGSIALTGGSDNLLHLWKLAE